MNGQLGPQAIDRPHSHWRLPASSAADQSAGTVMAMITTPDEALARTEWMLEAGYVSHNRCKLAAVRLLRNYRYEGSVGGLLVPLAAAGYVVVDAEDGMWEIDLMRLMHAAVDPRIHGVTPAGLKVAGFAAALARVPSTLGIDEEGAEAIASALAEAIGALPVQRG
jgi:hypothetical protein